METIIIALFVIGIIVELVSEHIGRKVDSEPTPFDIEK